MCEWKSKPLRMNAKWIKKYEREIKKVWMKIIVCCVIVSIYFSLKSGNDFSFQRGVKRSFFIVYCSMILIYNFLCRNTWIDVYFNDVSSPLLCSHDDDLSCLSFNPIVPIHHSILVFILSQVAQFQSIFFLFPSRCFLLRSGIFQHVLSTAVYMLLIIRPLFKPDLKLKLHTWFPVWMHSSLFHFLKPPGTNDCL